MDNSKRPAPLTVRPYQLLCVICSMGEGHCVPRDARLKAILDAVREDPDRPLTIRCNAGDVYFYQDPGTAEDTPEGPDYNRKRDLDLMQKMDWVPGVALPARTAFLCVLKNVPTVAGICGYATVTADGWQGCPKARSGSYEQGRQKGIGAIIPLRSEEEMASEKEKSLQALYSASEVTIRPHILLCAVCQYGNGVRPPLKEDNLPELLDLILHQKPDILITMARQADWMMCAPCPQRVPGLNACVNVLGSGGLSNEKRDLDMLQKLGLHFGSTMKGKELFRLLLERIPTTLEICGREGNRCPSVWWDACGESSAKNDTPNYTKGRALLMQEFAQGCPVCEPQGTAR